MKNTKELSFNRQRENDNRPFNAKEELLLRRALALQDEVEKFLVILPYDTVLTDLQMQVIRLQDHIMRLKASDVDAKLDDIDRQMAKYRSAGE